jgi:hypothetical protein
MRTVFALAACVALAGCQTVADGTAVSPPPERIALVLKSWGAPVHSWTVEADGTGTSVTRVSPSGSPWPPYALEHRRFVLPAASLARLQALVSAIPNPVPSDADCKDRITDAMYGTLSLTSGGVTGDLPFYGGCFDAYYAPYLKGVKAMDDLVQATAEKAPVERREEVPAESG